MKDILAVYEAKQEYERLAKTIRDWNQKRKADLRSEADRYLSDMTKFKDKKKGFSYARETMERNIRDVVQDPDLAEAIIEAYVTPVHKAEAQKTKMKNAYRDRVKALNLSQKVDKKNGNTVSEAHAVQLLGEAEDNISMLEKSRGIRKKRDGKTIEEWRGVIQKLWQDNPALDEGKIRGAVTEFRKIYDELYEAMNQVRMQNGYEPVSYRHGYFPHFQLGANDSILAKFGRVLGIDTDVTQLPTTINGMTHAFKPGIRWIGQRPAAPWICHGI